MFFVGFRLDAFCVIKPDVFILHHLFFSQVCRSLRYKSRYADIISILCMNGHNFHNNKTSNGLQIFSLTDHFSLLAILRVRLCVCGFAFLWVCGCMRLFQCARVIGCSCVVVCVYVCVFALRLCVCVCVSLCVRVSHHYCEKIDRNLTPCAISTRPNRDATGRPIYTCVCVCVCVCVRVSVYVSMCLLLRVCVCVCRHYRRKKGRYLRRYQKGFYIAFNIQ